MPTNKEYAERYGYALAFLKSEPELWALFQKATNKDNAWDDAKFEAELKETKWFKKHSDTYRSNSEQKYTDPGTWKDRLGEMKARLGDVSTQIGAELGSGALDKIANDALLYGWTDEQIRNKMAGYIDTLKGTDHFGGEAGVSEAKLRQIAADYGRSPSDGTVKDWIVRIARGDASLEDYVAKSKAYAESAFPAYADQIKSGLTLREVADPYMQSMAEVLELNGSNLDLKDPMIRKALSHRNADTGKAEEYSIYDFENDLRKDPRYARTDGARTVGMNIMDTVLKDWGFRA